MRYRTKKDKVLLPEEAEKNIVDNMFRVEKTKVLPLVWFRGIGVSVVTSIPATRAALLTLGITDPGQVTRVIWRGVDQKLRSDWRIEPKPEKERAKLKAGDQIRVTFIVEIPVEPVEWTPFVFTLSYVYSARGRSPRHIEAHFESGVLESDKDAAIALARKLLHKVLKKIDYDFMMGQLDEGIDWKKVEDVPDYADITVEVYDYDYDKKRGEASTTSEDSEILAEIPEDETYRWWAASEKALWSALDKGTRAIRGVHTGRPMKEARQVELGEFK